MSPPKKLHGNAGTNGISSLARDLSTFGTDKSSRCLRQTTERKKGDRWGGRGGSQKALFQISAHEKKKERGNRGRIGDRGALKRRPDSILSIGRKRKGEEQLLLDLHVMEKDSKKKLEGGKRK